MSGVRGNIGKLSRLAKSMPSVAIGQRVAARSAPQITTLAQGTFRAHADADGNPWPAGRDGRVVSLYRSGALFAKLRFISIGTRMRAVLGVPWAKFQLGKRPVFPRAGQAMPPPWAGVIRRHAKLEIEIDLRRAG